MSVSSEMTKTYPDRSRYEDLNKDWKIQMSIWEFLKETKEEVGHSVWEGEGVLKIL